MSQDSIVYVVDDDSGMRKSMSLALETAGLPVQSYGSAEEFLGGYNPDSAGCIVLDLSMPGMSGLECLQRMRSQGVAAPVLIVSGTATVPSAVEAMKLGVVDFLEKPLDHRTVLSKVQAALAQHTVLRASAAELDAVRKRLCQLTEREKELLQLVISGKSNKQIADDMGISIKTVANHRANLMEKTGALNAADLVRMAMIAGMRKTGKEI
jgi:FixJ family two-component response regulator